MNKQREDSIESAVEYYTEQGYVKVPDNYGCYIGTSVYMYHPFGDDVKEWAPVDCANVVIWQTREEPNRFYSEEF